MMRISHEGRRVNFSTGIKVILNQWDASKQRIKGNEPMVKQYNSLLQTFTSNAWDCYNDLLKSKVLISPEVIKQKLLSKDKEQHTLLGAFDYQINNLKARVGLDIAPNTVKKYETCRRKLLDFLSGEKGREDIFLNELSGKFIFELDAFLRTKRRLKHNAVVKNMQQLKRVIKVAIQNEWLNQDPFSGYSTAPKETDRGFLTEEELRSLEALELPSERLEKVRDIFIFCCYTGLAYADVSKLSKSHLIKGVDGNTWIILLFIPAMVTPHSGHGNPP